MPHVKERVTKELAAGRPQTHIAREIGLHPSQVSRFANREDIKKLIEEESCRLMDAVPDAVQNVIELVEGMKHIPQEDNKRRELSYKASVDVLKAFGLLPTVGQAQVFFNLFSKTNNTFLDPIVSKFIAERQRDLQLSDEEIAMRGYLDTKEE